MTASDLAGKRIREARSRRGWTVKDLAGHCAKAGATHITATVITNLETRRRATREITADELLALAHVLDVPPVQLISPLNAGEQLQITPGVSMDVLEAAAWLGNENRRAAINPASALRRIRRTSEMIRADYRLLGRQEESKKVRDAITEKGGLLMLMLGRLADLGYQPPEPGPEVAAALRECGQPASLAEWRAQEEGGDDE